MVSPVNASRLPSRVSAHHSGSRWLAKPYLVEDFHLLSFASLSWRTPEWVDSGCLEPYIESVSITGFGQNETIRLNLKTLHSWGSVVLNSAVSEHSEKCLPTKNSGPKAAVFFQTGTVYRCNRLPFSLFFTGWRNGNVPGIGKLG